MADPLSEALAPSDSSEFDANKLKPARSKAELVRTRNSNILLVIAFLSWLTNSAVALKVFGIIG